MAHKTVTFFSWLLGYVEKRLDKSAKVSFKIYDVTDWTTNNGNKHIAHYLKKKRQHVMKFDQLIKYIVRNIFLQKTETSFTVCNF